MKKIDLRNKQLIKRMLAGETLYFAEGSILGHKVWKEGRAEGILELERELLGCPVELRVWRSSSDKKSQDQTGFYHGVEAISNGSRRAGDPVSMYDLIHYWREPDYYGRVQDFREYWTLPGSQPSEVIDAMKLALPEYQFKYVGRSGFASRNRWVATGAPSELCQILVIEIHSLAYQEAESIGLPMKPAEDNRYNDTLSWFSVSISMAERELYDMSTLDAAFVGAQEEYRQQKQLQLVGESPAAVLEVEIGGKTGFTEKHIPSNYTVVFETVSAHTKDYRQGHTHQKRLWLADVGRLKKEGRRSLKLDLPQELRGRFIGKGGKNIKALQEKIGLRIQLI